MSQAPANARLESMVNQKSADFSQRMNTYFKKTNTYFIRFFLFSRCTDSGKTPQLTTSKLAQNCGKTEVLHLQPSYGLCWSHEIETLPPM
jgi:hypothetical protein